MLKLKLIPQSGDEIDPLEPFFLPSTAMTIDVQYEHYICISKYPTSSIKLSTNPDPFQAAQSTNPPAMPNH